MTPAIGLWLRRFAATVLLAIGALFALENTSDITISVLDAPVTVPAYLLVFAVLTTGFFCGFFAGLLGRHRPLRKAQPVDTLPE
ncbi:MAG: hypothetical protein GC134_08350 [Proteobacteria bacterium]|nr:hypothetical protein [Pseudomonadota bacterium]